MKRFSLKTLPCCKTGSCSLSLNVTELPFVVRHTPFLSATSITSSPRGWRCKSNGQNFLTLPQPVGSMCRSRRRHLPIPGVRLRTSLSEARKTGGRPASQPQVLRSFRMHQQRHAGRSLLPGSQWHTLRNLPEHMISIFPHPDFGDADPFAST